MGTIKPFERGFFTCHNAITDIFMPRLSGSAFKLLICALRQTEGWNKQQDTIAYSQFKTKTGISSNATIARALSELLEAGYLLRFQVGTCAGTNKPIYAYSLNTDYEIASLEIEQASSKNEQAASSEIEQAACSKNEQTTIHHTNNKHADDDVLQSLISFGIEQSVAKKLVKGGVTLDLLDAWIAYTETHNDLKNPIGFVVSRLKLGEYPPEDKPKEDDNPANSWIAAGALH